MSFDRVRGGERGTMSYFLCQGEGRGGPSDHVSCSTITSIQGLASNRKFRKECFAAMFMERQRTLSDTSCYGSVPASVFVLTAVVVVVVVVVPFTTMPCRDLEKSSICKVTR